MEKKRTIGVIVVDDQEVARQGLRRMLEMERDVEVLGDCSSKIEVSIRPFQGSRAAAPTAESNIGGQAWRASAHSF